MLPLLNQPIYVKLFGNIEEQYPVAKYIDSHGFYIGCHHGMTDEQVTYVIEKLSDYLNKYLIRTNRIINSFDNIKYKRIGFNEYEITDKRVLKAFLSRIPNLKASIKNISKQVIISTTILATLITSANAIKNAQNDPIIDEPKIDSLIKILKFT